MLVSSHAPIDPLPAVLMVDPGPHVFEKIFTTYCRPGCVLRDFSVTEIVIKSASVRSSLTKWYQERFWDVPSWIKQIPVLL